MPDSLGDRMKEYENISRVYLTKRLPVIIRVDGRAFHTFTRGFERPYDSVLHTAMIKTAAALCKEISGAKLAYVQSDEISVLATNDDSLTTQPWFDNNLQKIVSLSASMATLAFNTAFQTEVRYHCDGSSDAFFPYLRGINRATFDARAFVLPPNEVCNYFIWRQQDATRNSIQMAAQSLYSHKELQGKNCDELQEMIFQKGVNWNDYETWMKRGTCIVKVLQDGEKHSKWVADLDIPIFTQDREYIEKRMGCS